VRAVHVEVAQEHEKEAIAFLHKALRTKSFKQTTNLTMKLVPLFSDRLPSEEQDAIRRAITKQALCLAEFEFVSNPHINLIDEASTELHNHSLRTIVLAYRHSGKKKTFLSIDRDHNSGQVVLTYPRKYRKEANGRAHHLVKYMEYENGTPALRWFNYLGLAAASDMVWNAAEDRPISKSEAELKKLAIMEFDWLDCPDLNQAEDTTRPAMGAEDLSVVTFDKDHKPSGTAAADDNSLATAQASVNTTAGSASAPPASGIIIGTSALAPLDLEADDLASMADTIASNTNTAPSDGVPTKATTTIPGLSQLVPIDVDADDLASMADTVDASVESSSDSSSASSISDDLPDGTPGAAFNFMIHRPPALPTAPPEDMETELPETELPEADPDPVEATATIPAAPTTALLSVGDQQQTLGDGPPTAPPRNPPTRVLLRQTRAGGCKSPQLVPQDPPLPVPALILASATDTNPSTNEAPVPSTITNLFHGDGTGNGGITPPPPTTRTTQISNALSPPPHSGIQQPSPDNIMSPLRWATGHTYTKYPNNNSNDSTLNLPP